MSIAKAHMDLIKEAVLDGNTIKAIKLYREATPNRRRSLKAEYNLFKPYVIKPGEAYKMIQDGIAPNVIVTRRLELFNTLEQNIHEMDVYAERLLEKIVAEWGIKEVLYKLSRLDYDV